jgi:hypothetical protein
LSGRGRQSRRNPRGISGTYRVQGRSNKKFTEKDSTMV